MPPRPYTRPAAETSSAASERRGGSRPAGEIKSGKLDPLPVRLKRLGLVSDWDFVLHLPLRYEDETALIRSVCCGRGKRLKFRVK